MRIHTSHKKFVLRRIITLSFFIVLNFYSCLIQAQIFDTDKIIDTSTGGLISQRWASIAVDKNGVIAVAWIDRTVNDQILIFGKSTDRGETFMKSIIDSNILGILDTREATKIMFDYQGNIWITYQYISYDLGTGYLYITKSTDGGITFTQPINMGAFYSIYQQAMTADSLGNIFVLWKIGDGKLRCTKIIGGNIDNRRTTIIEVGDLLVGSCPNVVVEKGGQNIYCVMEGGVDSDSDMVYTYKLFLLKSSNGGASFSNPSQIDTSVIISTDQTAPNIIISQNDTYIYLTWDEKQVNKNYNIYFSKSSDRGNSFFSPVKINSGNESSVLSSICESHAGLSITWLKVGSVANKQDVYFSNSTDNGFTFSPDIVVGNPAFRPFNQFPYGIASDDSGYSYIIFIDNRYGNENYRLFLSRAKFDGVNDLEIDDNYIPKEITLYQNYPNPFNLSTNIKYSLNKEGKVKLEIFGVLGNKISTLIDKEQSPGIYKIQFDGSNISAGVYFFTLIFENIRITKKFILLTQVDRLAKQPTTFA